MVSIHSVVSVIFLAFFVFGLHQFVTDQNIDVEFEEEIINKTKSSPFLAGIFVKTLDELIKALEDAHGQKQKYNSIADHIKIPIDELVSMLSW